MGIVIICKSADQQFALTKDIKQEGSTMNLEVGKPVVGFTGYEVCPGRILMANNGRFASYLGKHQCL